MDRVSLTNLSYNFKFLCFVFFIKNIDDLIIIIFNGHNLEILRKLKFFVFNFSQKRYSSNLPQIINI